MIEIIVEHINDLIGRLIDTIECRIDLQAYTLAESVAIRGDEEITFPALVLPSGECISVSGETDKHDITLYHRLNDISFSEASANSYGSLREYTETADMSLIVFGKRSTLSPFEAESIARASVATAGDTSLVRSDFNALQIFASEYAGVTYFMSPEYYLFKINYRITRTYNPRCN